MSAKRSTTVFCIGMPLIIALLCAFGFISSGASLARSAASPRLGATGHPSSPRGLPGTTATLSTFPDGQPPATARLAAETATHAAAPGVALAPLSVAGHQLMAGGVPLLLHGVNRSGTEDFCSEGLGIFDGPSDANSVAAIKSWGTNAVRVPLNEDCWLGINGINAVYSGANYQQAIEGYVSLLNQAGLYAILELHWSAPGTTVPTGQNPMPDADHSPAFWTSVAGSFKGDGDVIFDLFNEPYPDGNSDTIEAWQCWQQGGTCTGISYPIAGMQELVNAVRATGASNVIMLGGIQYANTLDQWSTYVPTDPDNQLAASMHNYNYNICTTTACWNDTLTAIGNHPLIMGEIGENDTSGAYITSLMNWADSNQVSYLAWTWDTWGCGGAAPVLISSYSGTACVPFGSTYQQHLATFATNTASAHFRLLPGTATNISVGANGTAWVIGTTPINGNYGIYQWNGTAWTAVPGVAVTIAVGPNGDPWVINASHHIYHRVGTTWIQAPGSATDISVGANGAVWVIGTIPTNGNYGIYQWNGTTWTAVPGVAVTIAVGPNGDPWVINASHHIYTS